MCLHLHVESAMSGHFVALGVNHITMCSVNECFARIKIFSWFMLGWPEPEGVEIMQTLWEGCIAC